MSPEDNYEDGEGIEGENPLQGLEIDELENAMGLLGGNPDRVELTYRLVKEGGNLEWESVEECLDEEGVDTDTKGYHELRILEKEDYVQFEMGECAELTEYGSELFGALYETLDKITS
ncbi:MAG: hypothetical protein H8Z69_05790 [Nanohaloarchaea archaeon]|nr:hypothetical protein [Candidatus Nanohaloarchaea archaeon]